MRSIVSKAKNKDRFNQIIIGIVLIGVMFLSVVGYSIGSKSSSGDNTKKITYNGFEFINSNNYWVTSIEGNQFIFSNRPDKTPKIGSSVNYINTYQGAPLYIDSEDSSSTVEIYTNLNPFVKRMQEACLDRGSETACEGDLPIKNCSSNIIIISESNVTYIKQDESCVFIQGPKSNLSAITDEFLLKIIGIE